MSIADLIQWGRTAQRTGLLKLNDDKGKEIQVVFRDGRIVFSSTNDKREQWRSYVIYHGYCSDEDFQEAFNIKEKTGASVASVLVHERKLTEEQAISTLSEKTIEDVCDVFLWRDGNFAFEPAVPTIKASLTINLDPIHVMCEGIRRAEVWDRIGSYIQPNSTFERTEEGLDESTSGWEDQRMARYVYVLLDGDITVADLAGRLPFGRYKIYRAVSELLERRLIRSGDVTLVHDREKRILKKLNDARAAAQAGRWTEAMEVLQGLATANPGREDIVKELLTVTRGFERAIYEHNFTRDDVPVVTIGPDAISHVNIYPAEAFLLSRIDGRLTVREVLRISPMSEFEGLRSFKRLLSAKVIDFPYRKASVS